MTVNPRRTLEQSNLIASPVSCGRPPRCGHSPDRATSFTRREFLGAAGASAVATAAAPWIVPDTALGAQGTTVPSARITVGLIGVGCMGRGHLNWLLGEESVQLLAVCDVDRLRRHYAQATAEDRYAAQRGAGTYRGCTAYNDYRELLARPDIDAVVIATPDHWHTPISVHAAKAGKDIYCEKPISMTIQEGRCLVETVRRYGRVFQTGTQYRSMPPIRRVCAFVRAGRLGNVRSVFTQVSSLAGVAHSPQLKPYILEADREAIGRSYVPLEIPIPGEPVPEGLDWDLWVGPARWRPYNSVYHRNPIPGVVPWAFCADFGLGALTWNLSHAADVIQYALGMEDQGPVEIIHPQSGQFPTLTCRYANGTLLHYVDHWGVVKDVYKAVPAAAPLAGNFGGLFVGERGWITSMYGAPIESEPVSLLEEAGLRRHEVVTGYNDHHANWLHAIRTRKRPSSDVEIGHRSASLGHVANIAFRLGRSLKWDPLKEEFPDDDEANRLRAQAMRQPWRL